MFKINNSLINKIIISILFLLMPFLGAFLRLVMIEETADLPSKIIRSFLLYFVLIFSITSLKILNIPKSSSKYFLLVFLWTTPYLIHFLFSKSTTEIFNITAVNEIYNLIYLIFAYFILSQIRFRHTDYYFLIKSLSTLGLFLGIPAIWYSINVKSELTHMYIGQFLRSGVEATDPNLLSAILNISSIASLGLYFIGENRYWKFVAFLIFLISQIARFLTFSIGGFISIVLSLVSLFFILQRQQKIKFFKLTILIIIFFASGMLITKTVDIFFYRIIHLTSDESVAKSAIYSRESQYREFFKLLQQSPEVLLHGIGSAKLPEALGQGLTLHNSYLRPLAVGGIVSFISYLLLYWLSFKNFIKALKYSFNPKMKFIVALLFAAFIGWSFQAATLPNDTSLVNLFFFPLAYSFERSTTKVFRD